MWCFPLLCIFFQETAIPIYTAEAAPREVLLTGYTRAQASLELLAEVAARVQVLPLDMGDQVGEGGLFAQLDDTFTKLDIDANENALARLESRAAYLERETRRIQALAEREHVPQSRFDEMRQQLDQARLELGATKIERDRLLELQRRHRLPAPQGWTVMARFVEVGQWVGVGTPLGRVGNFTTLYVPLALDFQELEYLRGRGEALRVFLPDLDRTLPARIARVSPAFDPETRKTHVDLIIEPGDGRLRGGVPVELRLELPGNGHEVLLDARAVEQRYEEFWVTREDGTRWRVALLGEGPDGLKRVRAGVIQAGDRFRGRP